MIAWKSAHFIVPYGTEGVKNIDTNGNVSLFCFVLRHNILAFFSIGKLTWSNSPADELIQPCACRCDSLSPLIVTHVLSAVGNFELRQLFRAHMGTAPASDISFFFSVGRTSDAAEQALLEREASEYDDVLQANYIDSYQNLTRKTLAGLAYISRNCIGAQFVLKIDDDVFADWHSLVDRVREKVGDEKKFYCCLNGKSRIMRKTSVQWKAKWRVPNTELVGKRYYPRRCDFFFFSFGSLTFLQSADGVSKQKRLCSGLFGNIATVRIPYSGHLPLCPKL